MKKIQIQDIVTPDVGNSDNNESAEAESNLYEQDYRKARLEGLKQDIGERKKYANRIFWLISFWLIGLFGFIFVQGIGGAFGWFRLSDNISVTLITGTTVNVLGIFIIVVRYLFNATDLYPKETVRENNHSD